MTSASSPSRPSASDMGRPESPANAPIERDHASSGPAPPKSQEHPSDGSSTDSQRDVEAGPALAAQTKPDIEHMPVEDDPRLWSNSRKWLQVAIISYGALIPTMGANLFFPAIDSLRQELNASQVSIDLSVSLFILAQGSIPLLWSPVSEIYGRKSCFVIAMAFYAVVSGCTSLAKNMATVIALRVLAAGGSSATLAIAAGTIADMYEAEQRGAVVGVYYAMPISGPALGPIIGGALAEAAGWRATFWFLGAAGAAACLAFAFAFKETFRVERSAAWQKARANAMKRLEHQRVEEQQQQQKQHTVSEKTSVKNHAAGRHNEEPNTLNGTAGSKPHQAPDYFAAAADNEQQHPPADVNLSVQQSLPERQFESSKVQRSVTLPEHSHSKNAVRKQPSRRPSLTRQGTSMSRATRIMTNDGEEVPFKPSLRDVSPLGSMKIVLSKPHNLASLVYSGVNFAAQYALSFTTTQTFTVAPYNASPIIIGCILLALGVGGILGSVVGGRISDLRLRKVAKKLGHKAPPEERLRTVVIPLLIVVPGFIGYGWATQEHTNIAVPIVLLFVIGWAQIHAYSVSLSYLVDSNPGRSSGAVATNSFFRGSLAFAASQASSPILEAVNNGPLQTGWGVLIALVTVLLFAVMHRGGYWRDPRWKWPRLWRLEQWKPGRYGGTRWIKETSNETPHENGAPGEKK